MTAYYNENDPYAAQWLRNLIAENLIAPGVVDERSILDVEAYELRGFTQCHFFAGIGIWSGALRSIGWPDDEPIWTGSCPCQPFSNAGKQKGFEDERHLWPVWKELIAKCNPPRVVGEQVASKAGRIWLDSVSADMEALGFAFGASDLCAAGFDGAHIRQRLYFAGLADSDDTRSQGRAGMPERAGELPAGPGSVVGGLEYPLPTGRPERRAESGNGPITGAGAISRLADSERNRQHGSGSIRTARWSKLTDGSERVEIRHANAPMLGRNAADWLYCRDGKWRPVEPGTFPLVDAAPSRVGRLRAYGNALDFETAANFCAVVKELEGL